MIHFNFEKHKFLAVMHLLGKSVPDLDLFKTVKMLYLIDRAFLRSFGRPILGDQYICMEKGPVPSRAYAELKGLPKSPSSDSLLFENITKKSPGGFPIIESAPNPKLDVLSQSEIECISRTIEEFGKMSGAQLMDITHDHKAWKDSNRNAPIDYSLFFVESPEECREAYEVMLMEQEDRDFVYGI